MASDSEAPSTPAAAVVDASAAAAVSPVTPSSSSSSGMSSDMMQFLATLHGAQKSDVGSVASRLEAKKKERVEMKVAAKTIAKDLKKLRQAKARSHKKTKNASAEELLQALADRAAVDERKRLVALAKAATE
jgi:hypothetical protein